MSCLEKCLEFLHNSLSSTDSFIIHQCEQKVKEIEQICTRKLSKNELGFYCSVIFQSKKSVLNFLAKTIALRQYKIIRSLLLNFISTFVSRYGKNIQTFIKDVIIICSNIISKDHFSKNKDKALKIIDEICLNNISVDNTWIKNLLQHLMEELAKTSTNTTATVRGHVLQTLGIIAHYNNNQVSEYALRWLRIMVKELQKEMVVSRGSGDLLLIEGALEGIHGLLFEFSYLINNEPEQLNNIHKYARMALQPQTKLTRYGVTLAALKLFRDHGHLFSSLLIQDYKEYYSALETLFEYNNHHLKHASHLAIEAFFNQISKSSEKASTIQSKDMFLYFIKKFEKMIRSDNQSSKEMSLAVQGYGMLAGPCKKFLAAEDLYFMCVQMFTRCEHLYLRSNELTSDKLHRLPTYINALGNIVKQIETSEEENKFCLPETCQHTLEQVCLLMIENYSRLHNKFLFLCHGSLLYCMHAFISKPTKLKKFQYCLAYYGLIRSCSFDVVLGEDREKLLALDKIQRTNWHINNGDMIDDVMLDSRTVTFSNFVPLWTYFLQGLNKDSHAKFNSETLTVLTKSFTTCFIDAVIQIIEKLDLTTVNVNGDETRGINLLSQIDFLQAKNVADFRIFINLCDLCSDVFQVLDDKSLIVLHIQRFTQKLVTLSTKYPLVSGFYKLLASIMKLCERLKYFSAIHNKSLMVEDDDLTLNIYIRQECLNLLQKFAIELSHRLNQFKDELLNSALLFVLSFPKEVVKDILHILSFTLKIACQTGNDYLPLALSSLKVIDRWGLINFDNKVLLHDVVLQLEPFIHFSKDIELREKMSMNRKKSNMKKPKIVENFEEVSRKKVRFQVMKLFGVLGNDVAGWLKQSNINKYQYISPWDSSIKVEYVIPFRDMKPTIRLDQILWRVINLAKTSTERKVKISACELLHSILLYIIGISAQKEQTGQDYDIALLYKELFSAIFALACDNDQVCRQVFGPLINQIIHWFTKNKQFEHPSTSTLLNTIMTGIVDQDHASLRELCTSSLCEFLLWSVKQSSDDGYHNCKSILKRIYSFALHPSHTQRVGAYLALNAVYKVFRENQKLVDDFTFEILVVFLNSLSISHFDDPSYGSISLCIQALSHLERIITFANEKLKYKSQSRRVPKGFQSPVTLSCVVTWLFDQIGRPHTECRHRCMYLFKVFVKLLPYPQNSPLVWIANLIEKNGLSYIVRRFEFGIDGVGVATCTFLPSISTKFSVKYVLSWMDLVLAAVESYLWLFEEELVSPEQLFVETNRVKLFKSIEYFLQKVARYDLMEVFLLFKPNPNQGFVFSPQEKKQFNESKCYLISRILYFIGLLLKASEKTPEIFKTIPVTLWEKNGFLSLVSSTLFTPTKLGFDTFNNSKVLMELSKLSLSVLKSIMKINMIFPNSTVNLRKNLCEEIEENVNLYGSLDDSLPRPFGNDKSLIKSLNIKDLLQAYSVLSEISLLADILKCVPTDINKFACSNFERVFESVVKRETVSGVEKLNLRELSSYQKSIGETLLSLTFTIGISPNFILNKLMKSTPLASLNGSEVETSHGAFFLLTYSKQICLHLCSIAKTFIPLLCQSSSHRPHACGCVINSILDHLASDRCDRKEYSETVCDAILGEWDHGLSGWWQEASDKPNSDSLNIIVSILRNVLALDKSIFHRPGNEKHQAVIKMFSVLLSSSLLNLDFKNKLLDLIPFFCITDINKPKLEDSLESFIATHFPLDSHELDQGSSSFCHYSSAIRKLLNALEFTGDVMLLKIVVLVLCRERDHVMKEDIQYSVESAVSRMSPQIQFEALSMIYSLYNNTISYPLAFRSHCISKVLIPIAWHCNVTSVIEFSVNHIIGVMDLIKHDIIQGPVNLLEENLSKKTTAYRLMEMIFALVPHQHLTSNSSAIGGAYAKSQNQDSLFKSFMKCATRDRKSTNRGNTFKEEYRILYCSVYNAMIAAVICTQKEIKWYKAFLFDEIPQKCQYFLDDVIDLEKEYYFLMEISEPLKKRKRFAAIRQKLQDQNSKVNSNVNYLASVYESSLSEEVSVFDANTSRPLFRHSVTDPERSNLAGGDTRESMDVDEDVRSVASGITLECDELNLHECMPAMVALIKHMDQTAIGFSSTESVDTLPPFMVSMHRKLLSSVTHRNVRLFIAKLIINCESSFKRYASHWIVPLCNLLIRDDLGTNGINYMVCDLMVVVLSWNNVAIPEDSLEGRNLVQAVLEKLCNGINLQNRPMTRHNLDLIKTLLECWGGRIKLGVDPSIVYGLCGSYDDGTIKNYAGLQLFGALLSNGVPPYTPSYTVDRMSYFKRLFGNMTKRRKESYESSSEAAGMTLEYLAQVENEVDGEVHDLVKENLSIVHGEGVDKFITCLHKVTLHYAKIVDDFVSKIFFVIPKLQGDIRSKAFDILVQRGQNIPELYRQLKLVDFLSTLAIKDDSLQLTCCRLCHQLLNQLLLLNSVDETHEAMLYFLPYIFEHYTNHQNPLCRQVIFDISSQVYDFELNLDMNKRNEQIFSSAKLVLVKLLSDSEEALRNQVVNFWNSESHLPIQPREKLHQIFLLLYEPTHQDEAFLCSMVMLLLQSASLSTDYELPLFDNPLSKCSFQEYAVDHSWRNRHVGTSPMFVDTYQSSLGQPSIVKLTEQNLIKATQKSLLFTDTLAGERNTYNWMTGHSLDTFASLPVVDDDVVRSSFVTSSSRSKLRSKSSLASLNTSSDNKNEKEAKTKTGVDVDVERLRRRFFKETKTSTFQYAKIQELKKKQQERTNKDLKKRLENEVQMYRKYRDGELPDVEIPHRALIAPLAAACQYDVGLARIFAPILALSLIQGTPNVKSDEDQNELLRDLLNLLSRSQEKSPLLVGFVEDVCFHHHRKIDVDFSLIASASLSAKKEELGIALMEQVLLSKLFATDEPSRKRKRLEVDPEVEVWYEIARLYKSLGDYDVIQGIFHDPEVSSATKKGLEREACGSYKEARKIYEKALQEENTAKEIEKDMWEDCLLNCLKNLCCWDQVDKMCRDHLLSYEDSATASSLSLNNSWNHPEFIERYLDSTLHSKLILLLQGNIDAGDSLAAFIDDAMTSGEERREIIEKKFAEHLSVLYIQKEDYGRAKYYLDVAMEGVSMQWTLSDTGGVGTREVLIKSLSRLADLTEFLDVVEPSDIASQSAYAEKLLTKWNQNDVVSLYDPIISSYHHVMHRSFLLDHLRSHRIITNTENSLVGSCQIMMRLSLMEVASLQNNFSAAKKILSGLDEVYDQIEENDLLCIALAHKTAIYYRAQARHQMSMSGPSEHNLKNLLAAYHSLVDQTENINKTSKKENTAEHLFLLASSYHWMYDNIKLITDEVNLDISEEVLNDVEATLPSDRGSNALSSCLASTALCWYKQACMCIEKVEDDMSLKKRYRIYLELTEFCHKLILEGDSQNHEEIATALIEYVTRAMQINGSARSLASLKFPLLLLLLEQYPSLHDTFIKETNNLPSWMCLAWVSHLVALLDRNFASALHPLVMQLTNEYPQAVVYPFTTSLSGYDFKKCPKANKKFVKALKLKLKEQVPLAEEFIKHLRYVSDPFLIFKDWHSGFQDLLNNKEKQKASVSELLNDYQMMYKDLFDSSNTDGSLYDSPQTDSNLLLRSKFSKVFKTDFDNIFGGFTGSKVLSMTTKTFRTKTEALLLKMKNFKERSQSLKAYSLWLANFQPLQHGSRDLEIPGQYHGKSRPNLEYHVTISGFGDEVKMMSSIRKPCRISIRGSDEKEHHFLVKGGEDMRQDQRIEGLFDCINDLLNEEVECRKRNMSIVTYQVVPISSKVGVVEWMDNVVTYWEFIEKHASLMNCKRKLIEVQSTDWVPKNIRAEPNNHLKRYGQLVTKVSHTDAVASYRKVVEKLPLHILRNGYLHLAFNPESFIRLRKRFVTSYSVMCISHWLVGIGDRHTTNFVINTRSGLSVGIDFGHAFGSAVEVLPVPELVPFRLTRQICGLLSPHDVKQGEMRQVMIRCLSTIRSRSHVLLPILDVFIKDPSIDWLKFAKKSSLASSMKLEGDDSLCENYARKKIEVVKWKLNGGNPALITCEELDRNNNLKEYRESYKSVAKGNARNDFRSTIKDKQGLDVDVQVDCLLDQATDPNILGRMWAGWKSWC